MSTQKRVIDSAVYVILIIFAFSSNGIAEVGGFGRPQIKSSELSAGGSVTFRMMAPKATDVKLGGTDIPNIGQGAAMTKGADGLWEITLDSIEPGAYRYNFNVDGVSVMDPTNPSTSESNGNAWSLFYVPGSDFMDTQNVPHGAVSEITYYSKSLNRFRRMHVYTPAGYELGKGKYPTLYLLHGAFDCDDSWTSVGRAGFILDNLIASGKAEPMVVIMPKGHTGPFNYGQPLPKADPFIEDFVNDIMPYAEKNYRVYTDRKNRAIAGLSMGGGHTLTLLMDHMDKFGYAGVFSSGVFELMGQRGGQDQPSWEERHADSLNNAQLKKGLNLLWFATGKDDFLLGTTHATVKMLRKHDFRVYYKETDGGHTWINWRNYLNEFAPQLFKSVAPEKADNRAEAPWKNESADNNIDRYRENIKRGNVETVEYPSKTDHN